MLSPELLLPAGGFDSAIAAIEGGADALYLGFEEFSARKSARNFDRLEYRRLYRFARGRGIRLYVTLNTVLLQSEIGRVAELLAFLGRFPPDAALVQDWGLAALIHERHPGIAIHASTQAAVQGSDAVRIARELGASRVVLPRETSLEEMARLRQETPDMEFEAFVHGALCYSFSGLCLASGLVLGRSGNRGECAQLCRSYYSAEAIGSDIEGSQGRRGYWFSCRDMELGGRVGELAAAGICSLKVEGRMKGPEYCYAVARLYRGLIDTLQGDGPDDAEIESCRQAARTTFSRSPTEGWLFERGGAALIDSAYPGHRGVKAGRISQVSGGKLTMDLATDLGLRDGLLGFEHGDESRPLRFSVIELRDSRTGRDLVRAKALSRVEIEMKVEGGKPSDFKSGDELYRISARELDRKAPSPEEYEAERETLGLKLRIGKQGIGAELELPTFGARRSSRSAAENIEPGDPVPLDRAKSLGGFERALSLFSESGDADFLIVPAIDPESSIDLPPGPNGESRACGPADLFVPPSTLKREKNRIYAKAAELVEGAEISYALDSVASLERLSRLERPSPIKNDVPPRAALVFFREGLATGLPFAMRRDLLEDVSLPSWGGRSWLPLAPLVADRDEYRRLVREKVGAVLREKKKIVVGLGALHHFALARDLLADHENAGACIAFFLDFNLYVANNASYARLASLVPGIEFAYRYIEAAEQDVNVNELAPIGPGFEAPLFQSLGCFLKHHVVCEKCPADCSRSWSSVLSDRDRRYRVLVEDCVTMLFRTAERGRPAI
jgi:putative protease